METHSGPDVSGSRVYIFWAVTAGAVTGSRFIFTGHKLSFHYSLLVSSLWLARLAVDLLGACLHLLLLIRPSVGILVYYGMCSPRVLKNNIDIDSDDCLFNYYTVVWISSWVWGCREGWGGGGGGGVETGLPLASFTHYSDMLKQSL